MANGRDPNKRLVGGYLPIELVGLMDLYRNQLGEDRVTFLTRAIIEKLRAGGLTVPASLEPPAKRVLGTDFSAWASPQGQVAQSETTRSLAPLPPPAKKTRGIKYDPPRVTPAPPNTSSGADSQSQV